MLNPFWNVATCEFHHTIEQSVNHETQFAQADPVYVYWTSLTTNGPYFQMQKVS